MVLGCSLDLARWLARRAPGSRATGHHHGRPPGRCRLTDHSARRRPRPAGAGAAITKSYQSFVETRTCEYTVLGWSAEGTLYYQETCEDADPQTWSYGPGSESEPSAIEAPPPDLFQQTVPRRAILDWVRAQRVRPADADPSVRGLAVRVDGLASPDGRRVAVVVRYIYGPEDVLVLESEADGAPLVDVPD